MFFPSSSASAAPDDLVYRIFDHGSAKPCGNILNGSAVLLRLLYGGIHKHGASRAKLNGRAREKTLACEILHGISHGFRKGFDKRAAAGGACLVKADAVDGTGAYLEAFYVLPADVDYEIHIGVEMACRREMGDSLDDSVIHAEGVFDKLLAVARDGAACKGYTPIAEGIYFQKLVFHDFNGVASVGIVKAV